MGDECYKPGTPFSSYQETYLLDWEEHHVIPLQTPKFVHDRVTKYRQGVFEKKVKEKVHDYFESRLYFQSQQRKLAKLINERHHSSLLRSLSGDGCSSEETKRTENNIDVVVDNFIKSVFCASETQERVLKLSDEICSLEKQVETLEAIKCGVEEEKEELEIKVMKAEDFECSLRMDLPFKEARLKEVDRRNFEVHVYLQECILDEASFLDTFTETFEYRNMLCSFYNKGVKAAFDDIIKKQPDSNLGGLFASSRKSLEMNPDRITLQTWYYELEAYKAAAGLKKNQAEAAAVEEVAGDDVSHIQMDQEEKNQAPKETVEGENLTEPEIAIDAQRDEDLQKQSKKRTLEKEEEELEQSTKKTRSGNGQVVVVECLQTADPDDNHSPVRCLAKVEKDWQKINGRAKGWSDKYLEHKLMSRAMLNEETTKRDDLERIPILMDRTRALHERVEDLQATVVRIEEVNKGLRIRLNEAKEFIAVLKSKFLQVEEDVDKIISDTDKMYQEVEDFTHAYNKRIRVLTDNTAKSTEFKKIAEFLHVKGFQATKYAVATNIELDLCNTFEPSSETDTKTGHFLEKC